MNAPSTARPFLFRFRVVILFCIYLLGFTAPWDRYLDAAAAASSSGSTAWLVLSGLLARTHWLSLENATVAVTLTAIAFAFAGAALRLWGTAYMGAAVMQSPAMHAHRVVAAGPYRYLRNPLYLGSILFSLGISVLMPPTGAIFFLIASTAVYLRLVLLEEQWLTAQQGENYLAYKRAVPRIVPALSPRLPSSSAQPRWGMSLMAECYSVAMAVCFAVLAWRYNAHLLVQALIICFGVSLISHALVPRVEQTARSGAH